MFCLPLDFSFPLLHYCRLIQNAISFNGDLSSFDTAKVTTMDFMFQGTTMFDQEALVDWDVGSVSSFDGTFKSALAFSQNISSWNVSNVRPLCRCVVCDLYSTLLTLMILGSRQQRSPWSLVICSTTP